MDIDKVIKGLECHGKGGSKGCLGCPYELTHGCQLILCHDAIALLKEYELYIQHQKDGYAELEAEYNKLLKEQEPKEVKVWVTKTSDFRYEKMAEYESLKDCIDTLFETEKKNLVISKVPDFYSDEAKQCEYKVEIYDTWRE